MEYSMESDYILPTRILERYQQLVEISRDMASTVNLDILLRRIIQAAVDFTDAGAASILLWDQATEELSFQAVTNVQIEASLRGIVVPAESIGGWVALHRLPVLVPDAHQDQRFFGKVEQKTDFPTHSLLAVPLLSNDKLIGVLEVINKRAGTFTLEDQEALFSLGIQAALAIENNRLFEQSDLLTGLVHELRTPLSSLSTIAYLLQKPEISQEQRISLSKTIWDEIERLNKLASDFLHLSRMEAGRVVFERKPLDLVELLHECITVMAPKAAEMGVTLAVDAPADLPLLPGDGDRLKQLVINLLSNAIKYNRPNGTVTLRLEAQGDEMLLSVEDTGRGLTGDEVSHLFEKYFRARSNEKTASGTGLGLSICKKIVEGHHGAISVQSQLNLGTTFIVRLPLNPLQPCKRPGG